MSCEHQFQPASGSVSRLSYPVQSQNFLKFLRFGFELIEEKTLTLFSYKPIALCKISLILGVCKVWYWFIRPPSKCGASSLSYGAYFSLGDVRGHREEVVWLPYQDRRRVGGLASTGSPHQADRQQAAAAADSPCCKREAATRLPLELLTWCHQHRIW